MSPEQEALLQKARDNVRGAKLLLDECLLDIAAGRAYYAMFYVAEAFLLGRGLSFSKHSAVHAAFGQYFAKTGLLPAELHRQLIEAERIRNVADYGIGPGLDQQAAAQLIAQAEGFIAIAEQRIDSLSRPSE